MPLLSLLHIISRASEGLQQKGFHQKLEVTGLLKAAVNLWRVGGVCGSHVRLQVSWDGEQLGGWESVILAPSGTWATAETASFY